MNNKENKNEKITVRDAMLNEESNDSIEKVKPNIEQPKKSSLKRTIFILVTLAIFGGISFFIYTSQIKANKSSVNFDPIEINYTSLIDDWNKQVQIKTSKKKFLLNRDSNDKMMEQLEEWMKNFYIPETTNSSEYNQFLEKNKIGKPIYFDSSMSKDKVLELLKKATKEKVMSKIVKKVLMMNNMKLWKKLKR